MAHRGEVIVTGGAGYIGSHTVVDLQRAGYTAVVLDNLSNSTEEVLDAIAAITGIRPVFHRIDISRPEQLAPVMDRHAGAVGVIHFAAFKAVGESVEKPLLYYGNNVGGMTALLGAMAERGMDNLIFSSSCTVYGQPDTLPVTEDAPEKPAASPYGHTKQIGEAMLRDCAAAGMFRGLIALRYFNPVGADASALIGELPIGVPNNLMPFITQTAAGIRAELQVFGNDYATPDGTAIRDYIHVSDLAAAHRVALERLLDKKQEGPLEVFNIGTGRGHSVLEVIEAFERVTGQRLPHRIVGRRPGDVEQVWADGSHAEKVLGWKATRDLDEMVGSAWAWQQRLMERNRG